MTPPSGVWNVLLLGVLAGCAGSPEQIVDVTRPTPSACCAADPGCARLLDLCPTPTTTVTPPSDL